MKLYIQSIGERKNLPTKHPQQTILQKQVLFKTSKNREFITTRLALKEMLKVTRQEKGQHSNWKRKSKIATVFK
jgi:hypothetical protein